jgi:transposase
MRYLGLDVHSKATVGWLLDAAGGEVEHASLPTTAPALQQLIERCAAGGELLVGQEIGSLSYFVHDVVTAAGARILSFNAYQLRMIAASRKKTDRRDALWIAKALQTGMMPHPVYIPCGEVRRLRSLLSQREAVVAERKRWLLRARSYLRAGGYLLPQASRSVARLREKALGEPEGLDVYLSDALERCQRQETALTTELKQIEATLRSATAGIDAVQRLQTIPAVGERVAEAIYAWVGDVTRFPNARTLCSYAGLVPSVRQSGESLRLGRITRMGSPPLRGMLVQAGQVLLWRCSPEKAGPLREIALRVLRTSGRRKIAVVAAARLILRVAYYVLRDGTTYDPARLRSPASEEGTKAA